MMCIYPLMGTPDHAALAFAKYLREARFWHSVGTLPFLYLTSHGFDLAVLAFTLFIRGSLG